MAKTITLTMKQLQRFAVLSQLMRDDINGTQAAEKLGLSVRQIKRLKRKVRTHGVKGLMHGNYNRQSNRKVKESIRVRVIVLLKRKYYDYGPTFAKEKLAKHHGIRLSCETLRSIMTKEGLWIPRARQKTPQYRSKRLRVDMEGSMEQYDGSYYPWIEKLGKDVCLLASIDDATGKITRAHFNYHEGIVPTFTFWWGYAKEQGCLPKRLYVDKFSTYKVNHANSKDNHEMTTQFQRALNTLGVELIFAHSPQAKGRIERFFKTAQDRLTKELRYANITTMEKANYFLEKKFIPEFNSKFSVSAQNKGDARVPVPRVADLAAIFSEHHTRQVNNDFTVRFENKWYQIEKKQSVSVLRKDVVRMEKRLNGTVAVYHERRGAYLRVTCLTEQPKGILKTQVVPATTRIPYVPPSDHPWRTFSLRVNRKGKNTTLQTTKV